MGMFDAVGDFLTGSNSQSLGKTADESIVNVTTPGASSKFDPDTNTVTSELDPRHKEFQDLLFGLGRGLLGDFQSGDFQQEAQNQFDLMSDLGSRDRMLQSQDLENRLFNQGLLGSTAGQNQMTALQDSFADQQLQRELASRQFANQQRNQMFQQGLQGLGGVLSLDQLGMAPVQLGGQVGQQRAGLLANERLQSQDIGAGLIGSAIGGAQTAMSGGFGGGGVVPGGTSGFTLF